MNGVVYMNSGTKCIARMAISIHSLRMYYDGPVTVYNDGPPHLYLQFICDLLNVRLHTFALAGIKPLVKKVMFLRAVDYDISVLLDADTLVRAPIAPLFEFTKEGGMCFVNFEDWCTRGKTIAGRIEGWRPILADKYIEAALDYGVALNTGVFGFTKDHVFIDRWCELVQHGADKNLFIPDEIAAQILLPWFTHYLAPKEWNCSARYGDATKAHIIHYHGRKHVTNSPAAKMWRSHFWKNKEHLRLFDPLGDERLKRHMRRMRLKVKSFEPDRDYPEPAPVSVPKSLPPYSETQDVPPSREHHADESQRAGKWLDVVTTIVPRGTVQRAMENFLGHFDREGCQLRWIAHLDYVEAMQAGYTETIQQIDDAAAMFDEVVFCEAETNRGHHGSILWCFEQVENDIILWEDDKVCHTKFSYSRIYKKKAKFVTFLERRCKFGSTSPGWWAKEIVQHVLDRKDRIKENADTECQLGKVLKNAKGNRGFINLHIFDIGMNAQGAMGVARIKRAKGARYMYVPRDGRITWVTAVDKKYLAKLKPNFHRWQQRLSIGAYPVIVFHDNSVTEKEILGVFKIPHVQCILWEFPPAGDNQREKMLSAFVFGAAEHVQTTHWIKIDADVTVKQSGGNRYVEVFRSWFDKVLVGHSWGYTKVKGDPGQTKHWLNVLDEWWMGMYPVPDRLFPAWLPVEKIHKHQRIASYFCFHSTEFTREVATLCGERLPIPSHDTVMWYVAKRRGYNIGRTNMKKLGFHA